MQYNNLLFNCEWQYLKLVNLDLYQIIEPFWQGKMFCQFAIVVLVRAGMNIIFKILWKLIVDQKKEHLNSQLYTLQQNTANKERQLKKLQMSARKQISLEAQDAAIPIVTNLAKRKFCLYLKNLFQPLSKKVYMI